MKEYELIEVIKILNTIKSIDVGENVLYCTLDYNIEFTKKSTNYDSGSKPSLIVIDESL